MPSHWVTLLQGLGRRATPTRLGSYLVAAPPGLLRRRRGSFFGVRASSGPATSAPETRAQTGSARSLPRAMPLAGGMEADLPEVLAEAERLWREGLAE